MTMAWETPSISSARIFCRRSYSKSPFVHLSVISMRNAWSADKLSFVSLRSPFALMRASLDPAKAVCLVLTEDVYSAISDFFLSLHQGECLGLVCFVFLDLRKVDLKSLLHLLQNSHHLSRLGSVGLGDRDSLQQANFSMADGCVWLQDVIICIDEAEKCVLAGRCIKPREPTQLLVDELAQIWFHGHELRGVRLDQTSMLLAECNNCTFEQANRFHKPHLLCVEFGR